jgi:predicted DCC family thiol-disulfide oxidoreductase YuxK
VSGSAPLVFLYDGHCRLCSNSAKVMKRLAHPEELELLDFQSPGALDTFPQVSFQQCMEAAQLVDRQGHAWSGLEAVVRGGATRWYFRPALWVYRVPLLRQLGDRIYAWVAANRYRLFGRVDCGDSACAVHLKPPRK